MTIFETFRRTAAIQGARPFLAVLAETASAYGVQAGEVTYGQALQHIERLIQIYREANYGYGQRVGLLLENRPSFFWHWFALNALGVSVVPINPDLRAHELEYLIGHSEVVAIVAIPGRHAALASAAGRRLAIFAPDAAPPVIDAASNANEPDTATEAALLYTSGTTGRPKGCVLTNEYFLTAGAWYGAAGGLMTMRNGAERMLTPLPLFHMNAMACSTMAMVCAGGCLVVLDRFHPGTWWASVRESRATIIHYLGVMPPMLMSAPASPDDKMHDVRFGFGAGVDRGLHAAFEQRFGFPLIEAWAMTETGNGAVVAASHEPRHVGTGCFGRPGPDIEVAIVDEAGRALPAGQPGELWVRHAGRNPRLGFFDHYLKDPETTEAAWAGGWFHTGDVVLQGEDGSLYFVDRRKNIIRRSGENISAVEVESALMQHPGLRQVAIAPVADAVRGDEVFACIVTHAKLNDKSELADFAADLVTWCLERLAYYKAPGYVAFVDTIPLTTTQKIQRGELKTLAATLLGHARCIDTRALKKRSAG